MAYPASIETYTSKTDGVDDVMAADVNELQAGLTAVMTELGVDPAGTAVDVVTRLARALDGSGNLAFADATTLTISGGAVTVTQNVHRVDTEASAATDDLDTINGGGTACLFLILRPLVGSHNIVIKHNTGNIQCAGGVDITLDNSYDYAILYYDVTLTKWLAFSSGPATGAATLSGNNTWTGTNKWDAAETHKYSTSAISITLDATHYCMNVDASGGARTVTLPTAVNVAGRQYVIRKLDSSANAVTVDGNESETINGAATYSLTAQYQTVSIMSDGAGWMVL